MAQTSQALPSSLVDGQLTALMGAALVIIVLGVLTRAILTSRRLSGSSLFNRLFIVVAVTSAFFSAVSSAIGFSLITSQESDDFFRNAILPPAFGVFVFFLALAIWVGGAELVRHRDWFRDLGDGFFATLFQFMERSVKIFLIIPILATILFFVSTWTTVVGIGGVDAVRHTYGSELARLQVECAGISAWRQRDYLFLEDLRLAVADVSRVARNEQRTGGQTGAPGRGAVTDYFDGVAEWLANLEASVAAILSDDDPSGVSPYQDGFCAARTVHLKSLLSASAYENYDRWAREFETEFENFAAILNRWRRDRRVENLLAQQLLNFDRANPFPINTRNGRLSTAQHLAIERYAGEVESALKTLIRKQKLAKPPIPLRSAAEKSPARGLAILSDLAAPPTPLLEEKKSRTQSVVTAEFVPGLSTMTPRDAVLKNANVFSDVWALAIAWDYASYILMLAFLFFPSAERAPGHKDAI